jgi:hypothetical protein
MLASQPSLFGVPQGVRTTDDYYTPAWIFERMGLQFDLDVAAPPEGVPWIPAGRYYTKADDGLHAPWVGRVWMNPPYSQATPWVSRFIEHHHGVCLVPHAKSAWHNRLWAVADGVVVPERFFDFTGGPSGGSIMLPVWFAAFGDECVEAIGHLAPFHRRCLVRQARRQPLRVRARGAKSSGNPPATAQRSLHGLCERWANSPRSSNEDIGTTPREL